MPAATLFRLVLGGIVALNIAVVAFYRWRAATSEKISHAPEGYVFAFVLRLVGATLWLSMFACIFFPHSVAWAEMSLPASLRWFGAMCGAASPFLMGWTLAALGHNLTDTVATRSNATLVVKGPYRWVRHPFYVATAAIMFSATLLASNWLVGIASALVMGLLVVRTPNEERHLVDRFGDAYLRYIDRTGRFFPRWHS